MGIFCENCGRELQEGEVCTCQQQKENEIPVTSENASNVPQVEQPVQAEQALNLNKEENVQTPQGQPQIPFQQKQPQGQFQQGQPQIPFQQGQPQVQFQQGQYQQGQPQVLFQQGQPQVEYQQGQSQVQFQQGQYQQGQPQVQFQQGQYQQGQPQGQFQQGQPQMQFQQGQFQQGQPYVGMPKQPNQTVEKAKGFLIKAIGNFLNLIKNPITSGQSIVQESDAKMAGFLIGLQAVFSAFFAMIVCNRMWQAVLSASKVFMDELLSAMGLDSFGYYFGDTLEDLTGNIQSLIGAVPYGKTFFYTLVFSVLLSAILAGAFVLGYKIIKIEVSYQKMLSVVSLRSALLLPTTLVAMVLALISPLLGIIVFAVASIWGFVTMLLVMQSSVSDEKKNVFAIMYTVVLILFLFVFLLFDSMGIKEIAKGFISIFS